MALMDEIESEIRTIVNNLHKGERVMIVTTEKCGCTKNEKCHLCDSKGYIMDAKTWLPKKT